MEDRNNNLMDEKEISLNKQKIISEKEFMEYMNQVPAPEGITIHYNKNDNYIEYHTVDSLYAILINPEEVDKKVYALKQANSQLYQIRNYDDLTGLPTIHNFRKIARKLVAEFPERKYAIVYSDINRFKYINETLGYDIGDMVLCDYARFISGKNMNNLCLARSTEDNFLAIVEFDSKKDICNHVLSVNEKFNIMERKKYPANNFIIVSGICEVNPKEDITVAIDNARMARKNIKDSIKPACKFFDKSLETKIQRETEITNCMEQALKNGEFLVYIQPKIGLLKNELVGAEALVRWQKNNTNLLSPDEFIPIFEKNGFIISLDLYVYEEVCKLISKRISLGLSIVPISVNVSRIHLNDEEFINQVLSIVDNYKIPHELLELELTESIFLTNTEAAISIMKELRKIGFGVSIDDFGAGYSSLNLLKDMETDVLKLDKEFLGHIEMQKEEQIIVSSIISMAKQLNMKVLSEGVETKTQAEFLKSVNCDMAQGYLFSRPIPMEEFESIMSDENWLKD